MCVIYLTWNLIITTIFQIESSLRLSLLLKYPMKKCGGEKPLCFCINFILIESNFKSAVYLNFKMFCITHFQKLCSCYI